MAHIRMKDVEENKFDIIKNGQIKLPYRAWAYGNVGTFTQYNNYIELSVNYGTTNSVYNTSSIIFNKTFNWSKYKRIYIKWVNGTYRGRQLCIRSSNNYNTDKPNVLGGQVSGTTSSIVVDELVTYTRNNNILYEDYLNLLCTIDMNYLYLFIGLIRNNMDYSYQGNPSTIRIYDLSLL